MDDEVSGWRATTVTTRKMRSKQGEKPHLRQDGSGIHDETVEFDGHLGREEQVD